MKKLKICLVDDHQLFREGIRLLLERMENIIEIREADNGASCLNLLKSWQPNIILMDIEMDGINGIETTIRVKEQYPDVDVIALSMYAGEDYYSSMIEAGASGFILKNSRFEEVKQAIKTVSEGHSYFSSDIMDAMVNKLYKKPGQKPGSKLSKRETEVLYLICKGLSNQEIGNKLYISKRTVDKHRENILIKTGTNNTAGLVMYAIKHGIVNI
ncbi:MAG: response regulator transcription factor [Bacteroidota bacterium]|nr:response regulator transcription factor [Bacteroidota bacterium]